MLYFKNKIFMIKWYIVMYKLSGYTYPIFNDNKITLHPN